MHDFARSISIVCDQRGRHHIFIASAMASKWKATYDGGRKYNKTWESKYSWLLKASDGSENAFCKLCHAVMKPKQSNLTKHENTAKHIQQIKALTSVQPIQVVRKPTIADEVKTAEIKLAVTMACHSSISTIDHLGEIISRNATGSTLVNIKIHRTKCTKILTSVVSPALKEELIADVKGKRFSLIVDETTDVSTAKQLCVLIRYYSNIERKIVTAFVGLVTVVHACADDLFNAIRDCLRELFTELDTHYKSLRGRVFDIEGKQLAIENVDLGGKFQFEATKFISTQQDSIVAKAKVLEVKRRCLDFLLEAISQVEKRLPGTWNVFKGLSSLHPTKVLNLASRVPVSQLPLPHLRSEKVNEIEEQYRKIVHRNWKQDSSFDGTIPDTAVEFWSRVAEVQTSLGDKPFKELAAYALNCLTTPVSNAVVERTFSLLSSIKTKQRNRMKLELLNAIIRIRSKLQFDENCCVGFKTTRRMLELFTAKQLYALQEENN